MTNLPECHPVSLDDCHSIVIVLLYSLYHYGDTMSLYVTCKREWNYLRSCTLTITRYTASISHALSYFHFHLSLVTLYLLLDTLLSLSHWIVDTQCIFSLSLFFLSLYQLLLFVV
eukprot:sb/3476724/